MIVKATGGYYYVDTGEETVECRARGLFRREKLSPCVGDRAEIQRNDDGAGGTVVDILPRKNHLIRPPLANLDYMVAVLSVTDPAPNPTVTDKFLAVLEDQGIEPLIAVTKIDRKDGEELCALYRKAGFRVFPVCNTTGEGLEPLAEALQGKLSAFSGNSGVGKSSLLNAIHPAFSIEVADTSKKLGRGRHTTRHVEIHTLPGGGLVADTPGFSSLDLLQASDLYKEDLALCFRDFTPYRENCRFRDCLHMEEAGCAVSQAVREGYIASSRYASYRLMVEELRDKKEWEQRK